jgi:SAM-dependent methyltransferase
MDDQRTHRLHYSGTLSETEFYARCETVRPWYHSYYFDNGFEIRGDYNIGADIADYGFLSDMQGIRVLDIGAGGGWFAHYFAQRGAAVTTVDARGYGEFDFYGRYNYVDETAARIPDAFEADGRPVYFSPVSKALWVMRNILGADIQIYNARVYDVCPELFGGKTFDLVFIGALLLHLRDPIGALMAARSVCTQRLIASTPVIPGGRIDEDPIQHLPWTAVDQISWWLPNLACFRHWFLAAGFRDVDVTRTVTLRSDVPYYTKDGRHVNGDQTHHVGHAVV